MGYECDSAIREQSSGFEEKNSFVPPQVRNHTNCVLTAVSSGPLPQASATRHTVPKSAYPMSPSSPHIYLSHYSSGGASPTHRVSSVVSPPRLQGSFENSGVWPTDSVAASGAGTLPRPGT